MEDSRKLFIRWTSIKELSLVNISESSEKTAETAEKKFFQKGYGLWKKGGDFIQILSNVNGKELSTFSPS